MILTFIEKTQKEGDAWSFVFAPKDQVTWVAGQYTHFKLLHANTDDRGDERWFTISSAPVEKNIVITTRISNEESSTFKLALFALQPGAEIEAGDPEGDFTVGETTANYIFIAGGIGITPIRSILTEYANLGQNLPAQLLYANRNSQIIFESELAEIQKLNPLLSVQYVIHPDRLDEQLLRDKMSATNDPRVYISGPEAMVEALTEQIATIGIPKDNIHSDYFPGYEAE